MTDPRPCNCWYASTDAEEPPEGFLCPRCWNLGTVIPYIEPGSHFLETVGTTVVESRVFGPSRLYWLGTFRVLLSDVFPSGSLVQWVLRLPTEDHPRPSVSRALEGFERPFVEGHVIGAVNRAEVTTVYTAPSDRAPKGLPFTVVKWWPVERIHDEMILNVPPDEAYRMVAQLAEDMATFLWPVPDADALHLLNWHGDDR